MAAMGALIVLFLSLLLDWLESGFRQPDEIAVKTDCTWRKGSLDAFLAGVPMHQISFIHFEVLTSERCGNVGENHEQARVRLLRRDGGWRSFRAGRDAEQRSNRSVHSSVRQQQG